MPDLDNTPTLAERMAAVGRGEIARAPMQRGESDHVFTHGGADHDAALAAARAHLGTDERRGSVEDAMIAGADLETG